MREESCPSIVPVLIRCSPAPLTSTQDGENSMLTYNVLWKINDFTRKMDAVDGERLRTAIDHVSAHTDFSSLLQQPRVAESGSDLAMTAPPLPQRRVKRAHRTCYSLMGVLFT